MIIMTAMAKIAPGGPPHPNGEWGLTSRYSCYSPLPSGERIKVRGLFLRCPLVLFID
jgi:hypothetical protein